jgi:phosphoglycerol transferase MdoB-like AlkP superfamily enzyme
MAIAILSFLLVFVIRRFVIFQASPVSWNQRLKLLILAVTLAVLSGLFINIDQAASQSENVYAQELSLNGLFSLAAAMRRNDLDYERFYSTIDRQEAKDILKSLRAQHSQSNLFDGKNPKAPFIKRPKNVLMITVESLSAEYLGVYGSSRELTPELDKIATQGLVFDRLYATGTRTVRGLEALSLGTPPIPGQAIVRRPHNQHLSTVGEYLEQQGVSTAFIYGGYGYFDNMNAYFSTNDYKVFDRTDFDPKSIVMENVWGVADESLFDNTLQFVDKTVASSKPFFIHVMTTSNHRPYTFPDGRIDLPQGSRKAAVKYTDYSIGRFLEQAKNKSWFDDTLFVIVADHCASVAGKTQLPVAKYHIQ